VFRPVFPYKGNQLILTSDRVTLHSKNDAIFLFGKQAVGLSSPETINLDAGKKIILAGPIIELGNKAQDLGQPIVLGNSLNQKLLSLIDTLNSVAILLAQVSTSQQGKSMESIRQAGQLLSQQMLLLNQQLNPSSSEILSKNTFTR
jgi:uncharacterized protein (DUF2345 family)